MAEKAYEANLEITAPLPVYGAARARATRAPRTSVARLCERAGIRYRVTGGNPPAVALCDDEHHGVLVVEGNKRVCMVARANLPQRDPERAMRILEVLAYGFNDYFARETICGRGYFVWPIGPEHGRAWLAAIGRKGGRRTSVRKARSSRRNGRLAGAALPQRTSTGPSPLA